MKRPSPPALVRAFDAVVTPLRGAEHRKMFGYPAVFVNGNMFAGLVRDRMILRLGEADHARFMKLRGAAPFVAMRGRVMKQWVVVPPEMLKTPVTLKTWLRRALATSAGRRPRPSGRRRRRACRRGRR